jgi:tripartite-type tricarboxylate transporter receptor subunit TctC
VIENRPGIGGNIGADVIAKAAPDGYTLGLVLNTTLTVNPSLYKKLPFDPDKDFRPISIVTTSGNMLVVHPSIPVNSVAEFVAFAKAAARKEPIAYASAGGLGSPGHLVMEYFRLRAGFEAIHVPYRSNPAMVIDLVAGQVKVGFVTSSGMMDHVQAGRLKGLGVARASRSPLAPDVPTIAESGYPGFRVENYNVILAPAGIPEPIAALLEREVLAALKHPDVIERLRLMDTTPARTIGPEASARIKADRAEWAKVVAAASMRLE